MVFNLVNCNKKIVLVMEIQEQLPTPHQVINSRLWLCINQTVSWQNVVLLSIFSLTNSCQILGRYFTPFTLHRVFGMVWIKNASLPSVPVFRIPKSLFRSGLSRRDGCVRSCHFIECTKCDTFRLLKNPYHETGNLFEYLYQKRSNIFLHRNKKDRFGSFETKVSFSPKFFLCSMTIEMLKKFMLYYT